MNDWQGIYMYLNFTYMHKGNKLIAEKSQPNSTILQITICDILYYYSLV